MALSNDEKTYYGSMIVNSIAELNAANSKLSTIAQERKTFTPMVEDIVDEIDQKILLLTKLLTTVSSSPNVNFSTLSKHRDLYWSASQMVQKLKNAVID